jgi:hypothetical protein
MLSLGASCLLPACAPTFSELQSAKLVGPGRVEITPNYSSVSYTEDHTDKVQDHFGIQFATGVSEKADIRFRYEYIDVKNANGVHVVGAGPKFSLVPDQFALYVPVGTGLGEDVQSGDLLQIQPTALFTGTLSPHVELTVSGKAILWFDRELDDYLAFNLGAGISKDLSEWAIRPEAGVLVNPGDDGAFWHLSIGFTKYVDRR